MGLVLRSGLGDSSSEGNFTLLSNGEAPIFTNWDQNEPNNSGEDDADEDCVHISSSYKWNDRECHHKSEKGKTFHALCEM